MTYERPSPEERFAANTEWVGDCLLWKSPGWKGYGMFRVDGKKVRVHRYAWEQEHGEIPKGKLIDHTCFNRSCVNVKHLRLASPGENSSNRAGPNRKRKHDLPRNVKLSPYGDYMVVVRGDYLGTFPDLAEAERVAEEGRRQRFGDCAGRG